MSHLIEAQDTLYVPTLKAFPNFASSWHGLETPVKGKIRRDGSNVPAVVPPVEAVPASAFAKAEWNGKPIQGWGENQIVLVDCGEHWQFAQVAGKRFEPSPNEVLREAVLSALDEVVGADNYVIAAEGTLANKTEYILSVYLKQDGDLVIGKEDKHQVFFNANGCFSSRLTRSFMLALNRIVCGNTLQMSIDSAGNARCVVKYTRKGNALITPKFLESNLRGWIEAKEQYKRVSEAAIAYPMKSDDFRAFAAGVYGGEKAQVLSTRSFNEIEAMTDLFERGKGNGGANAFDAFNAFTDHYSHLGAHSKCERKREAASRSGAAANWKRQAFLSISSEEEIEACKERGVVLYADKVEKIRLKALQS